MDLSLRPVTFGLALSVATLAGAAVAQNTVYLKPSEKRRVIGNLERNIFLLDENLRNYETSEYVKFFPVPPEYARFASENKAILEANIAALESTDLVARDHAMDYWARICAKGTSLTPTQIMASIAIRRSPKSCAGCTKPPVTVTRNTLQECRKTLFGLTNFVQLTDAEALEEVKLALATRFATLRPVKIASVDFDTSARDRREALLRDDLETAEAKVAQAQRILRDRERALEVARQQQDTRIAQLMEPIHKLEDARDQLALKMRQNPDQLKQAAERERNAARAVKADARIGQIDSAIANLVENYPASDTFAQNRIRELRAERAALVTDITNTTLNQPGGSTSTPSDEDQARLSDLTNQIFVDGNDALRRIALERSAYDSALTLLRQAQSELLQAEQNRDTAFDRLSDFKRVRVALFDRMFSDHADFTYEGELPDLSGLNAKIHRLSRQALKEQERIDGFRIEMLNAINHADTMARELGKSGQRSIAAQVLVELGFSAFDFLQAFQKGKTAGMAAEGFTQLGLNMIFKPSYVDAQKGTLADFISLREDADALKYLKTDEYLQGQTPSEWGKNTGLQIAKHLLSQPKDIVNTYLEKKKVDAFVKLEGPLARTIAMKTIEADLASSAKMSDIAHRMAPYFKMLAHQEELAENLAKALGRRGSKAFMKGQIKGLATGALKEVTKEIGKTALAEWIEQSAFEDYMNTQLDMAIAVAKWREAGMKLAQLRGELELERATRDTLLKAQAGYDPETGWTEQKNLPWFITSGYAIWLDPTEETTELLSDVTVNVALHGIELERIDRSTQFGWRLPDNAIDLFGYDVPDELELVIKIE